MFPLYICYSRSSTRLRCIFTVEGAATLPLAVINLTRTIIQVAWFDLNISVFFRNKFAYMANDVMRASYGDIKVNLSMCGCWLRASSCFFPLRVYLDAPYCFCVITMGLGGWTLRFPSVWMCARAGRVSCLSNTTWNRENIATKNISLSFRLKCILCKTTTKKERLWQPQMFSFALLFPLRHTKGGP